METLKGIGGCLLAIVGFVAIIALTILFFSGAGWVSEHVLPWLFVACYIAITILVVILLPLSLVKKARGFTAMAIFILSYIFGISAWMYGLLTTLSTWGVVAVIIGLLIGGVGVVPIGLLAALFHGEWEELFGILILVVLTFGCRFFAIWLDGKNQEHKDSRQLLEEKTSFESEP